MVNVTPSMVAPCASACSWISHERGTSFCVDAPRLEARTVVTSSSSDHGESPIEFLHLTRSLIGVLGRSPPTTLERTLAGPWCASLNGSQSSKKSCVAGRHLVWKTDISSAKW